MLASALINLRQWAMVLCRRRGQLQLLTLVLFIAPAVATGQGPRVAPRAVTPTRSGVNIALSNRLAGLTRARAVGQTVVGYVAAVTLGFAAWSIVDDPEGSDRRVKGDAGYTPNANSAFAVASFVGATAATYIVGRGDGSRGSLLATALGAGIPSVVLLAGRHEPYLPPIGIVLVLPFQAVGGTLGYRLSLR
jgi:hypothetical protein